MEAATQIVSNLMPRYTLVNLPLVDLNAHINGGPEALDQMYPIVMNADRLIGEFVKTLKTLGIYDKSVIVITADHGFATGHEHIFPQKVKAELKAIGIKVDHATGGEGYMTFWLGDLDFKDNQKKRKAAKYLTGVLPSADAIFYKATFDVGGREVMQYVPVKDSGSPVYVKLLNTALAPQGPDIVAFFGDYTDAYNSEKIVAGHGGAGWMVQNIPIIMGGPGVPRGLVETLPYSGPRIVDIAPTLVALTDPSDEYIGEFNGRPIFNASRQQMSTFSSLADAPTAKLLEKERL